LNTLTYQKQHTIEEQVYFIKILVEKFINQEFKEESNPSEGLYSETTSDTETTEVNYILTGNNIFISEFNTYPDYSIINYEITNMTTQQVIDAIGNLVTSLNQRNNEKMIIQIRKYKGGDQDPVEWLRDFEVAALANGITNDRKIQVVRGYLEGAAASWFDEQRNLQNDALYDWTNGNNDHTNFKYTFEQQF